MKNRLIKEDGSVMVLLVLLLPILIGIIGITIDGGMMVYHKNLLSEATEAAGRSAVLMSYDKDIWDKEQRVVLDLSVAKESVEKILKLNFDKAEVLSVSLMTESSLVINTSVTVEYTFMKLFGFNENVIETTQTTYGG